MQRKKDAKNAQVILRHYIAIKNDRKRRSIKENRLLGVTESF
jgi:hypothetical protein